MVIREALHCCRDRLLQAGIENGNFEARHMFSFVLGLSLSALLLKVEDELHPNAEAQIERLMKKRLEGIPLAYVLGTSEFFGRSFLVSPAVLIPRPETEQLVEEALARLPQGGRFFDLCTGSGCIGITLAAERPDVSGVACDLSEDALAVAEKNAAALQVSERLQLVRHDLLSGMPDWGTVDVIVSNPPYIKTHVLKTLDPEVVDREPTMALDGGGDGLDFYRVLANSARCLNPGGWLLMEIGYDQKDEVEALLMQTGCFTQIQTKKDYAGLDRMVLARRSDEWTIG